VIAGRHMSGFDARAGRSMSLVYAFSHLNIAPTMLCKLSRTLEHKHMK
jgi:hypothetical protein